MNDIIISSIFEIKKLRVWENTLKICNIGFECISLNTSYPDFLLLSSLRQRLTLTLRSTFCKDDKKIFLLLDSWEAEIIFLNIEIIKKLFILDLKSFLSCKKYPIYKYQNLYLMMWLTFTVKSNDIDLEIIVFWR